MELSIVGRCSTNQTQKAFGLSLNEIARRFNSPLLEEQAWAVCHLCASKLVELQWPLLVGTCTEISMETVVITTEGSVELIKAKGLPNIQDDAKTALENLGVMVYSILDYGLPEDQERILSQPLENLIEMMTELDEIQSDPCSDSGCSSSLGMFISSPTSPRTRDSGITISDDGLTVWEEYLSRVIKACELHVIELAEPQEHYRTVCQSMMREALAIMVLDNEEEGKSCYQQQDDTTAKKWEDVMEDIKHGVKLKVSSTQTTDAVTTSLNVSEFDVMLMNISKFDKCLLRKVDFDDTGKPCGDHHQQKCHPFSLEDVDSQNPLNVKQCHRATGGNIHSSLMSELKTRPTLKPVSDRSLRPTSLKDRPRTPMESLMEEIQTPHHLKKVERTSPNRLSLNLNYYRLCKSNPDLLDISPRRTSMFGSYCHPSGRAGDRILTDTRNLSQSTLSLYNGSPLPMLTPPFSPSPCDIFGNPHHVQRTRAMSESLLTEPSPSKKQRSKGKKSKGKLFQRIVKKFSHSMSSETPRSAGLREKRTSFPSVWIADSQVSSVPHERDNMCNASFNGFSFAERSRVENVFYSTGHEYHYRTPQHHQPNIYQRPSLGQTYLTPSSPGPIHLATPTPGQTQLAPPSPGAFHLDTPPLGQTHLSPGSTCRYPGPPRPTVIVEESTSQVSLWNIPDQSLGDGHVHSSHSLTPSNHYPGSPVDHEDVFLQLPSDVNLSEPTNLQELMYVRSTVTKAELYNLQLEDIKLYKSVSKQKICFSCLKTRFSLFNQSHLCFICKMHVCSKCSKKHSLKDSDSPQRARLAAIFKDASQNVKSVLLCSSCFSAANLVPGLT